MESSTLQASKRKQKRVLRIRKRIIGSTEKPRLCFIKANQSLSIQVIDDSKGLTLASLTSLSKEFKKKEPKREIAKKLGSEIAKICLKKGINSAVMDRRGNKYHGILAAFADAAREQGLQF